MEKKLLFSAILILGLSLPGVFGQEIKREDIPNGTEAIEVGGTTVVVPKGMKVVNKNGLITMENISDYVARQLPMIQEELANIKLEQEELKKEIAKLKEELKEKKAVKPN